VKKNLGGELNLPEEGEEEGEEEEQFRGKHQICPKKKKKEKK